MTMMKDAYRLPDEGFIRMQQVLMALGGISSSTLYDGIAKGHFPAPKKLTKRTSVWSVREIRALIEKIENGNDHA